MFSDGKTPYTQGFIAIWGDLQVNIYKCSNNNIGIENLNESKALSQQPVNTLVWMVKLIAGKGVDAVVTVRQMYVRKCSELHVSVYHLRANVYTR